MTQPSSLYREVVFGYRWSLRQVSLYPAYLYCSFLMNKIGCVESAVIWLQPYYVYTVTKHREVIVGRHASSSVLQCMGPGEGTFLNPDSKGC